MKYLCCVLTLFILLGHGNSQVMPCAQDYECPYEYYCHIHYCTPCFNCLKVNRKFNVSVFCPKKPEECGKCIEGYEVEPYTAHSWCALRTPSTPAKKGPDLDEFHVKVIFISVTLIFLVLLLLSCVILRWEIRTMLLQIVRGESLKYSHFEKARVPSAPPLDMFRGEEREVDIESNQSLKWKTPKGLEKANVEQLNEKSQINLQQSSMFCPPDYEINTCEQYSPCFSLGFSASGRSVPTLRNVSPSEREYPQQSPHVCNVNPQENASNWDDRRVFNFFNNEIIINQSVNHAP